MKRQSYTIRFNTSYDTVLDGLHSIGTALNQELRDYVEDGLIDQNIFDTQLDLNDSGNEVTVTRLWNDSAYNEYILLPSYAGMIESIENLSNVESIISYGFEDVDS